MQTRSTIGDGVAVIPAVDPDPNVTPPPLTRLFKFPTLYPGGGFPAVWLAAEGGTPTVEIWVGIIFSEDDPDTVRFFRWNNASVAVPQDQMIPFPSLTFPVDSFLFVRITAVGGATRILLGLTA